mgnify:CR=1 FL=1
MGNRTPIIVLLVASGSSLDIADINLSIKLMPDGLIIYNIPRSGGGALR